MNPRHSGGILRICLLMSLEATPHGLSIVIFASGTMIKSVDKGMYVEAYLYALTVRCSTLH